MCICTNIPVLLGAFFIIKTYMIKQFRSLSQANLALLIVITLFLRLVIFIQRPAQFRLAFLEPLMQLLIPAEWGQSLSSEVNLAIALVAIIIQGLLVNHVVNIYSIIGKPTFLPALLFVTFSSLFPQFTIISPALVCNFLLIWIIYRLLAVYQSHGVRFIMFDIGMMVAVGTLIYFPFIAILPIVWISLVIFRPFVWREWILGLVGFLTIYFLVWVFYFWNDSLNQFYKIWLPLSGSFTPNFNIDLHDYFVLVPVAIIFLLAFFQLQQNFFRKSIQTRKSFEIFFFLLVLALASLWIEVSFSMYHLLLCVPTASIFAAYFFLNEKRGWLYESLYLLLIGAIVFFQLF